MLPRKNRKQIMRKNYVGLKFGKLKVVEKLESELDPSGKKIAMYLCKCFCGGEIVKNSAMLKRSFSLHCGCLGTTRGKYRRKKCLKK